MVEIVFFFLVFVDFWIPGKERCVNYLVIRDVKECRNDYRGRTLSNFSW